MEQVFEQRFVVGPSVCDADRVLSHPAAFNLLQDISTMQAARLGIGPNALAKRSLTWLIVKAKLIFERRPALAEKVLLRTWPEEPGRLRCNRSYEFLSEEGELLLRGRTEWAVLSLEKHRVVPVDDIFPPELKFDHPPACTEAFPRIPDRFDGLEPFAHYTVTSSDIDLLGHMNNAAYPRALFGRFSMAERRAMDAQTVDLVFRSPCYEAERLDFRRRWNEGALDIRVSRGEDPVFYARILPRSQAALENR